MTEAPDGRRLVHGVGFYGTDDEFKQLTVPFCEAGIAAGAPTIVKLDERDSELLRSALGDTSGVTFLPTDKECGDPPRALAAAREALDHYGSAGAAPTLLLGELPAMTGLARDAWLRFEAAVNHVLAGYPARTLCAYDTRVTPVQMQAELLRTHHVTVTDDAVEANRGYMPPEAYIPVRPQDTRDPLEATAPAVRFANPSPASAREAVAGLAEAAGLEQEAGEELLVCVNEAVSNAVLHGRAPYELRGWMSPGRIVVAVTDAGAGPRDPFVGLWPSEEREWGGMGLWIAHQLCPEIALSQTQDGFTVRIAAGSEAPGQ